MANTTSPGAPTLRPYQRDTLSAIWTTYNGGLNRLLAKLPTGTGKTVMFAELPAWWRARWPERKLSMLVVAHREELLDQAAAKIQAANPGLVVQIEQAERRATPMADVIVASIQSLQAGRFARLKRLQAYHGLELVVVDEAHHSAAPTYRTLLVHLGFLPPADASDTDNIEAALETDVAAMEANLKAWDAVAAQDRVLVGVTATPNRSDAIGLGCVFQSLVYSYALRDAVRDGWLVDIKPLAIETRVNLEQVGSIAGEFNQRELAHAVNTQVRNDLGVAAWHEHAKGRPTLAFTVDVAHAHQLAEAFRASGVRAKALSGETPTEARRAILADYTAGRLDVITNCAVLTEGTDLPRTSCILHAKPTRSATLYEQMTGRGLRLFEGKTDCLVIDLVDLSRRHSLMTTPTLYGLPPGLTPEKAKSLAQTADEFEALLQAHPAVTVPTGLFTLAQLNALAIKVNPWAVQPLGDFGHGRRFSWVRTGDDCYSLSFPWTRAEDRAEGFEVLTVTPNLIGQWGVSSTFRTKDGNSVTRTELAHGLQGATQAAAAAEAYVQRERRPAANLKAVDAPWTRKPATEPQIKLLRLKGIPVTPGMTSGQASQAINQYNATRRTRR